MNSLLPRSLLPLNGSVRVETRKPVKVAPAEPARSFYRNQWVPKDYGRWPQARAATPRVVLYDREVLGTLARLACERSDHEVFGYLYGDKYDCGDERLTLVGGATFFDSGRATAVEVHCTHEDMAELEAFERLEWVDSRRVGWFHSHLNYGIVLSRPDISTHELYFYHPWQVALVLDPLLRDTPETEPGMAGFFVWARGGGELDAASHAFRLADNVEPDGAPPGAVWCNPPASGAPADVRRWEASLAEERDWLIVPPTRPGPRLMLHLGSLASLEHALADGDDWAAGVVVGERFRLGEPPVQRLLGSVCFIGERRRRRTMGSVDTWATSAMRRAAIAARAGAPQRSFIGYVLAYRSALRCSADGVWPQDRPNLPHATVTVDLQNRAACAELWENGRRLAEERCDLPAKERQAVTVLD